MSVPSKKSARQAADKHNASGSSQGGAPDRPRGARRPRTWDEIEVGDLVVVQSSEPENGWEEATVVRRNRDMFSLRWCQPPNDRLVTRHRLAIALLYPDAEPAETAPGECEPNKSVQLANASSETARAEARFPARWDEIDVGHLVLAKEDGPLQGWWEAVPIEKRGDTLILEWRDHKQLPKISRSRYGLALLHPKP
jgi:hypothetical protein